LNSHESKTNSSAFKYFYAGAEPGIYAWWGRTEA
jgi:hypothetical protein